MVEVSLSLEDEEIDRQRRLVARYLPLSEDREERTALQLFDSWRGFRDQIVSSDYVMRLLLERWQQIADVTDYSREFYTTSLAGEEEELDRKVRKRIAKLANHLQDIREVLEQNLRDFRERDCRDTSPHRAAQLSQQMDRRRQRIAQLVEQWGMRRVHVLHLFGELKDGAARKGAESSPKVNEVFAETAQERAARIGAIRRRLDEHERAFVELFNANRQLVVRIGVRYRALGLPFEALIEKGHVGLERAMEYYDPRLGLRFCTYAEFWARAAMKRALANQTGGHGPV